jgi:hypothetical protein
VSEETHPGSGPLRAGFPTPSGRARFVPVQPVPPAEPPTREFPLVLTTGRLGPHWHTRTRTRWSRNLEHRAPEPVLEINPADARRFGVVDGGFAEVRSRRGEVVTQVRVTAEISTGTVFLPLPLDAARHFGEAREQPDARRDRPDLEAAGAEALRRTRARPAHAGGAAMSGRRLVMVGNGMAGLACLDAILQRDPSWQSTVFGDEPQLGYNRILLSTLLAGECSADTNTPDPNWYAARRDAAPGSACGDRPRAALRDDTGARPLRPLLSRRARRRGSRPSTARRARACTPSARSATPTRSSPRRSARAVPW